MARWKRQRPGCYQHFNGKVLRKQEPGMTFCWCTLCGHKWIEMPLCGGEVA